MKENIITLKNVIFDKNNKTIRILKGDEGTYPYTEISKCQILFEDYRLVKKHLHLRIMFWLHHFNQSTCLRGKSLLELES